MIPNPTSWIVKVATANNSGNKGFSTCNGQYFNYALLMTDEKGDVYRGFTQNFETFNPLQICHGMGD